MGKGSLVQNRVLEIVVFLMSHIKEHQGQLENFDDISDYLKSYGYTENEISSAYSWVLDQLQTNPEFISNRSHPQVATRVLTEQEKQHFTPAALGYVLQLRHLGLLTEAQLEMILDRISYMGTAPIDLDQIKIVIESVLFHEMDFSDSGGRQRVYVVSYDDDIVN